jgi:hypothetical protein
MEKLRVFLLASCFVTVLGICTPPGALAQNPSLQPTQNQQSKSALAVSPAIVEHVLVPGEKKEFTLNITNLTNFPLPISGTVKNFVTLEDVEDPKKQAMYDASKWFTISEPNFILQPNQTRTVTISILPPPTAEPGGHYATVYFQPLLPSNALTPSTSYLTARVGTLAFLIQPGNLDERLTVRQFSTASMHHLGPIDFKLEMQNLGNIHLSPTTNIEVYNWLGKKIAQATAPPGIIVPGTRKNVVVSLSKELFFGKYTAVATTASGAQKKELQLSTTFWVIPWSFIATFIPALIVLLIALRTRGRWKRALRILRGKE